METTYQTCMPSAPFAASPSPLTVAPRSVDGVRVDVVRERTAANGIKVGAFVGDRAFGLAAPPRSVPV